MDGGIRSFGIQNRLDEGTRAVIIQLTGEMTEGSDADLLVEAAESFRQSKVTYFVFDLTELSHLHRDIVGNLAVLNLRLEGDGLIVLVGMSNQPLQILQETLKEQAFRMFKIVATTDQAKQAVKHHRIAAMNQVVNPRYF